MHTREPGYVGLRVVGGDDLLGRRTPTNEGPMLPEPPLPELNSPLALAVGRASGRSRNYRWANKERTTS